MTAVSEMTDAEFYALDLLGAELDSFFRAIPEDWYDYSDGDQNAFRWFGVVQLSDETTGMLDEMDTEGIDVPDFSNDYFLVNIYDDGTVWAYRAGSKYAAMRQYEQDQKAYADFLGEAEEF